MKTTNGKLRNITSGTLHTDIGDVYQFLEQYLDAKGIMTHQLPSACKSLVPILKRKLGEEWFTEEWLKNTNWQNDSVEIPDLTQSEKDEFWKEYEVYSTEMWNSIKDKAIVIKT